MIDIILWQDSNNQIGRFTVTVLDVDIDCVRLSKFIETKLNCQYEDGKAFYEVTENEQETEEDEDETEREEDLLYYKKILRPQKNEVSCAFRILLHKENSTILCSSIVRNWNCNRSLNIFVPFLEYHPWQSNQSS